LAHWYVSRERTAHLLDDRVGPEAELQAPLIRVLDVVDPVEQHHDIVDDRRTHPVMQREALEGLLDEVGFADVLLAYERDGVMTLVDGHLRADILGDELVPVGILDVDDEEARKILATLDPLAGLAVANPAVLQELIDGLHFNSGAITDMLSEIIFPDYGQTPSLDDLGEEYGEGAEDDFWQAISLRVPRDVKAFFDSLMDKQEPDDEAMRFKAILTAAAGA